MTFDSLVNTSIAAQFEILSSKVAAYFANLKRDGAISTPFEEDVRGLAETIAADFPTRPPSVGFDRPTNIYLLTEIYQTGGHRVLLNQLIAARPRERHLVIMTGGLLRTRQYTRDLCEQMGAFVLEPDADLTLFDRHLWARNRLATLAPQRVWMLTHPQDVSGACLAYQLARRIGRRLYIMRHSDTVPSLGSRVPGASHVALRPAHRRLLTAHSPDLAIADLSLAFVPHWHVPYLPRQTVRDIAAYRPADDGPLHTATCGGMHKFSGTGELDFTVIVPRILKATGGRHTHIGPIAPRLVKTLHQNMKISGIAEDRLTLIPDVASVSEAFVRAGVDILVTSFPVGGGLTASEAGACGIPMILYRPDGTAGAELYLTGSHHAPAGTLSWGAPDELTDLLQNLGRAELNQRALEARKWYEETLSADRFCRRLQALYYWAEGRRRTAPPAPPFAKDVFDADYYRTQLDPSERSSASLAHYRSCGETRGLLPNPLFDARLYREQVGIPDDLCALDHFVSQTAAVLFLHTFVESALLGQGALTEDTTDRLAVFRPGARVSQSPTRYLETQASTVPVLQFREILGLGLPLVAPLPKEETIPRKLHFWQRWRHSSKNTDPLRAQMEHVFDPEYYSAHNPDIATDQMVPFDHFLHHGQFEGRNPSEEFSSSHYLKQMSGAALEAAEKAPLAHFLSAGAAQGLSPHPHIAGLMRSTDAPTSLFTLETQTRHEIPLGAFDPNSWGVSRINWSKIAPNPLWAYLIAGPQDKSAWSPDAGQRRQLRQDYTTRLQGNLYLSAAAPIGAATSLVAAGDTSGTLLGFLPYLFSLLDAIETAGPGTVIVVDDATSNRALELVRLIAPHRQIFRQTDGASVTAYDRIKIEPVTDIYQNVATLLDIGERLENASRGADHIWLQPQAPKWQIEGAEHVHKAGRRVDIVGVDFHNLTIGQAVSQIGSADLIIGANEDDLALALFTPPETEIVLLTRSCDTQIRAHWDRICAGQSRQLTHVVGAEDHQASDIISISNWVPAQQSQTVSESAHALLHRLQAELDAPVKGAGPLQAP
ncbi:MAG: hypothetical protein AAGA12_09610 [Pseudomonadota bacterium]